MRDYLLLIVGLVSNPASQYVCYKERGSCGAGSTRVQVLLSAGLQCCPNPIIRTAAKSLVLNIYIWKGG